MEEKPIAYNDLMKLSLDVHYFMAYEILNDLEQCIMQSDVSSPIVYDFEIHDSEDTAYWKVARLYTRKMKLPYGKYYRFDCGILEYFIKKNIHNIDLAIKQMVGNELWISAWIRAPYFINHTSRDTFDKDKINFYQKMFKIE